MLLGKDEPKPPAPEENKGGENSTPGNTMEVGGANVQVLNRNEGAPLRRTATNVSEKQHHEIADEHKVLIRQEQPDLRTLHRDELRLPATFNYSRVMRYLVLVDDVFTALEEGNKRISKAPTTQLSEAGTHLDSETGGTKASKKPAFPRGAFSSMFGATILALILQCGISAAAIVIVVYTPKQGLGCRSLGYTVYGGTSILILFATIISTILARISDNHDKKSPGLSAFTKYIAILLRWTCVLLAYLNAVGLIVISCLQFSNFFDSCWCNASVIGNGSDSFIVMIYSGWVSTMRYSRIAATVFAGASMTVYMFFLWFKSVLPE